MKNVGKFVALLATFALLGGSCGTVATVPPSYPPGNTHYPAPVPPRPPIPSYTYRPGSYPNGPNFPATKPNQKPGNQPNQRPGNGPGNQPGNQPGVSPGNNNHRQPGTGVNLPNNTNNSGARGTVGPGRAN